MNVLGGLLGRKGLTAVIDRQYLKDKNYHFDSVTSVRIVGDSIRLMVDCYALEFLPGEVVSVSRTRKAMLEMRDRERRQPQYDFGVYYKKWEAEIPEEHNCLDVDWLVGLMREERRGRMRGGD